MFLKRAKFKELRHEATKCFLYRCFRLTLMCCRTVMPLLSPSIIFSELMQSPINVTHIFRAVMGLYLALALFWIAGALLKKYQSPALYSLVVSALVG